MRNRKALALFAVLALVAAACGGSGSGGSDDVEEVVETTEAPATTAAPTTTAAPAGDPLVLASLMPLSGDLASLGPGIALGAALAVQQINAAGGINGQDVVLIEGDSGCDGAVALTSLNDVIAQGAQGVMGAACSGTSLAILDTAIAAEVVMVSPSNTSPQFTKMDKKGFYARTAPSDLLQGDVLASLLLEDGVESISIISRADAYGRGLAEAIGGIRSKGFGLAQQAALESGRGLGALGQQFGNIGRFMGGAGQQFAGLGTTGLTNLQRQIQTLGSLGATGRGVDQATQNARFAAAQRTAVEPRERLQTLQGMLGMLPTTRANTTYQALPGTDRFAQTLGFIQSGGIGGLTRPMLPVPFQPTLRYS